MLSHRIPNLIISSYGPTSIEDNQAHRSSTDTPYTELIQIDVAKSQKKGGILLKAPYMDKMCT